MKSRKTGRMVRLLLPVWLLSLLMTACGSDISANAIQLRKTEGAVRISNSKDREVPTREERHLYSGYNVQTQVESYAWVDLDRVKLLKMDESSRIAIERKRKALTVLLEEGDLFFNVTEPLDDDESMEIRTSDMMIGIRGTCGWVESPKDENGVRVYLLEGKVACSADGKEAAAKAGEVATLTSDGEIVVESFSADDIPPFVRAEAAQDADLERVIQGIEFSAEAPAPAPSEPTSAEVPPLSADTRETEDQTVASEPETTPAPASEPKTTPAPASEPETMPAPAPASEPETTPAPASEPETTTAPASEPETTATPKLPARVVDDGLVCSYGYDSRTGDPANGIPPGMTPEELPDSWRCPVCGGGKETLIQQ